MRTQRFSRGRRLLTIIGSLVVAAALPAVASANALPNAMPSVVKVILSYGGSLTGRPRCW